MNSIRVLIVEGDTLWRKKLKGDLEKEPDISIVEAVSNKEDAIQAVHALSPDIVLMDINFTGNHYSGLEAIKEINKIGKSKVIVLTCLTNREAVLGSFEHGALNFLSKSNVQDVVSAIRDVHAGKASLHHDCAEVIRMELKKVRRVSVLTKAQREVYELKEAGLNKEQIAHTLNKSVFTIKNQLRSIRERMFDVMTAD